jgi:hypothetical protein
VSGLGTLAGFLACMTLLTVLSGWMSGLVQGVGWLLFRDERAVVLMTFVVFLPGIVIHELSHWLMAWVLGLRPHRLSLWPKVRGKRVEMGSVRVRSGGVLRDTLTGMAPLLVGTLILLLISYQIFDVAALQQAWTDHGLAAAWTAFWSAFGVPNAWLWAYLLFAVSNATLPSSSDRQPLLSLLSYVLILGLVLGLLFYLTGGLPRVAIPVNVLAQAIGALRTLTTAAVFAIALDGLVGLPLLALQVLLLIPSRSE